MLAYSSGVYNTLMFFHVLAAMTWVGSASLRLAARNE